MQMPTLPLTNVQLCNAQRIREMCDRPFSFSALRFRLREMRIVMGFNVIQKIYDIELRFIFG